MSSKNFTARGSFGLPEPEHRLLAHLGLRLVRATSISFGTPSSFGSWLSAKTAFFFTSVSGSLSIALVMVADRLLAGLLRQPEQRLAADPACSCRRAPSRSAWSARRRPC